MRGFKKTECEGDTQQREAPSPADSLQAPGLDSVMAEYQLYC